MTDSAPYTTAYTPLETLLLFQALRAEGPNTYAIFNRISEQLKSISAIRSDPTFDQGRLTPDALRELYLWLLKEEVKRDLERQLQPENVLHNGDGPASSRKRKAPSPSLPTVHEASQHAHLIPQLVTRLYTRYREHAVKEIREYERKYDALTREVGEIEAGAWDEKLQKPSTTFATQSPRPSTIAHTQPALQRHDHVAATKSTTASPISPHTTLEGAGHGPPKPYARSKIGDVMNYDVQPQTEHNGHRRTSSNTTLPPLSEMAPQSPRFGIPPKIPAPMPMQMHGHGHSFNQSPPIADQSPYGPHHAHPMPSPQVPHDTSRPSSSHRPILPPPPGMRLPQPSPIPHSISPSVRGPHVPHHQQYPQPPPHRLSTGPSPVNDRPPHGYAPPQMSPHMSPHMSGYYHQPPYPDRRVSYTQPQQQHAQAPYPTQPQYPGGYQVPPFSVEQSPDMRMTQPPMLQYQHSHTSRNVPAQVQRPSYPPYTVTAPPGGSTSAPAPGSGIVTDIIAALATPPKPQRNRSFKRPSHLQAGTPAPSPVAEIEPLSPLLQRTEPSTRTTRATRNREATVSEPSVEPEPEPSSMSEPSTRRRTKRNRSPHSVDTSTADESARMTRSHSVSTAQGAIPTTDDRPGSRGNVKIEPSTPARFVSEPETAHELPSTSGGGGPMTRKRRGTLQSQPQPPSKRKRQKSPERADAADESSPPPPSKPTTVHATRNFHKLSGTIMDDINSHKHAAYFANLVRDKDAPGYSEIIKQPQHRKSIRAAIIAGTRAVNAIAQQNNDSIELPLTEDLMPPKAIVNGAQLEKEVMRMFANAVMFNPGEDGMVSDAREMFEDIEGKIREWRGANPEGGEGEVEIGEEVQGKGKRRKV